MTREKVRSMASAANSRDKAESSQAALAPVRVEWLDSVEAFDQLQGIWQELERQDTQCTPFNTWIWNSLWWHHYGTRRDRLILLIARQANRVVGIAPLYIHATKTLKVIPVRVLRFIGSNDDTSPDYLGFIALPSMREAIEQALLDYLPQIRGWHKLQFSNLLQTSSLVRKLEGHINAQPGTALGTRTRIIQKAALPASFEDYCAPLNSRLRLQIDQRQTHLDTAGTVELNICATTQELAEASDALVFLHRARCGGKVQAGGFCTSADEQFHRAVIRHFFAMDALWLSTLKLDGGIIAVQYLFAWRGELMFMYSGDSPEHQSLCPADVLFDYSIQRGIEQGMEGLNMLKEHHAYQSAHASDQVQTIELGYLLPGVRRHLGVAHDRLSRLRADKSSVEKSVADN